jgi:subtilisin family serine protease
VNAQIISKDLVALRVPGTKCDVRFLTSLLEKSSFVQLDFDIYPTLHSSVNVIGAPQIWNSGFSGKRVNVGVLDSGVDAEHHALWVEKEFNFSGGIDEDSCGHGTHVAGIISSTDSNYRGVAYHADLLSAKVIGGITTDSAIIRGYEWLKEQNCKVINMSLGRICDDPTKDLLRKPIAEGWKKGIINVASSGNEGPQMGTILAPGCFEECIAVGAVNNEKKLAEFSSRGPTKYGRIKPELVAPGVNVTSCRSKYSRGKGEWISMSGTSMAAPHTSGAAAILAEYCLENDINPEPELIKNTLMASAENLGYDPNEQGAGLINLPEAIKKIDKKPGPVSLPPSKYDAKLIKPLPQLTPTLLSELAKIQTIYHLNSVGHIAENCIKAYSKGAETAALKIANLTILKSNLKEELKEILEVEEKIELHLKNRSLKKHLKNALAELNKTEPNTTHT